MRKRQFLTKIIKDFWSLLFIYESTQICQQGCFFFHHFLATSMTNVAQIFTGLLIYAYVGIHQVRRLVFDNYQTCSVPLKIHVQSKFNSKKKEKHNFPRIRLKALYTFGNCQRPVFSIGVSHHKHTITSLWKFGLNRSSKLRENDERKNTLVGLICVLSDRNKRLLARSILFF